MQVCLACEHGINVNFGWKHTFECRQTILPSAVTDSSSSHEVAPNLHDSSGEIGDPETRESVMKKSRVDADMEISAFEALTNAMLEVDRALDKANKT